MSNPRVQGMTAELLSHLLSLQCSRIEDPWPVYFDLGGSSRYHDGGIQGTVETCCPGNHTSANQTIIYREAQHRPTIINVIKVAANDLIWIATEGNDLSPDVRKDNFSITLNPISSFVFHIGRRSIVVRGQLDPLPVRPLPRVILTNQATPKHISKLFREAYILYIFHCYVSSF